MIQPDDTIYVAGHRGLHGLALSSDNMADACLFLMCRHDEGFASLLGSDETASGRFAPPLVNIGGGSDMLIAHGGSRR